MKTILLPLIIFAMFAACKKAPKYNRSIGGGDAIGEVVPIGDEIPGTPKPVTDQYTGIECSGDAPTGFRLWRRLSNVEFKNTVSVVFGVKESDYEALPDDITKTGIYDTMNDSSNFVNSQRFRIYTLAAKKIADKVAIATLFPCLKDGASCLTKTLPTLGELAWRRPLTTEEVTQLSSLYTATAADLGSEGAARLVVRSLILSQSFLYRSELGAKAADGSFALTDWEMASAISYTVLRMPPDAGLRALAAAKKLNTKDVIAKEISRLFLEPQAKVAWKDFANMWLDARAIVTKSVSDAKITEAIKKDASVEAGELFSEIFNKTSASTLSALLTSDSVPSQGSTNAIYAGTAATGHITFKEAERRGVLGLGSYLIPTATLEYTSPAKRGAYIIERLMCTGFAPVGTFKLPDIVPGQTNRQRYEALGANPSCGACHKPMNEYGFVMENFDSVGRYRTMADGKAVDSKSTVHIDGKEVAVSNAKELSDAIGSSSQGQECYSRHIFRYALGRLEYTPVPIIGAPSGQMVTITKQTDSDSCQLKAMSDAMVAKSGDLKTPIIELLTNPAFRKRIDRKQQK